MKRTGSTTSSVSVLLLYPSEDASLRRQGYELIQKLGEGKYSKVYKYKTPLTTICSSSRTPNSILACKIIDMEKTPKYCNTKFLPREIEILKRLDHPHIIQLQSIMQSATKYFIFMELADNGDLMDYILKNGAVSENQARVWFRELVVAVRYLHDNGIAHRSITCENILLSKEMHVKLTDFSFSRYVADNGGKVEMSETYCGSMAYAAPELLKGAPYNAKIADIWACGVVLYVMLNNAMPFDDSNMEKLKEQEINHRWKFRKKQEGSLSTPLKILESHLLEPDVNQRCTVEQILASEWLAMDRVLSGTRIKKVKTIELINVKK